MASEKMLAHLAKIHAQLVTHGLSGSRIQTIWFGIKQRCFNPKNHAYKYYGGRGITICDRWRNSLQNFVDDMGIPPEGMTIDRIDNNGNYEPGNCRWVTRATQQSNRRVNRFIEFNGKRQTAMEWSKDLGIAHQTIYGRLDLGMTTEQVLSPNKHRNLSGLSLGGAASGAQKRAKTHCKHGHEFTTENTRKNGKNGRACLKCHATREAARRKSKMEN